MNKILKKCTHKITAKKLVGKGETFTSQGARTKSLGLPTPKPPTPTPLVGFQMAWRSPKKAMESDQVEYWKSKGVKSVEIMPYLYTKLCTQCNGVGREPLCWPLTSWATKKVGVSVHGSKVNQTAGVGHELGVKGAGDKMRGYRVQGHLYIWQRQGKA